MSQDIGDFRNPYCELLAIGEPVHREPVLGRVRNHLVEQAAGLGFRSVALETDRVAALIVDDYVRGGEGDLDAVMRDGFSHGWGDFDGNRQLVAWMRDFNEGREPAEQVAFHGFDAPTENMSAPSPRGCLEYARDFLGSDVDIASVAGEDERWSRTEAILDAAQSPGASPEAVRLREIGEELLTALDARVWSGDVDRGAWMRARTHLTAGLGLLRYHRQSSVPMDRDDRISGLMGVRDALMAANLLDIRAAESGRGPTLVHAHNLHLQRAPSSWDMPGLVNRWVPAGAIVGPLLGDRYVFIAGSLGASTALGIGEPSPDTYEGALAAGTTGEWGLTAATPSGVQRTGIEPRTGYLTLAPVTVADADGFLHVNAAGPGSTPAHQPPARRA